MTHVVLCRDALVSRGPHTKKLHGGRGLSHDLDQEVLKCVEGRRDNAGGGVALTRDNAGGGVALRIDNAGGGVALRSDNAGGGVALRSDNAGGGVALRRDNAGGGVAMKDKQLRQVALECAQRLGMRGFRASDSWLKGWKWRCKWSEGNRPPPSAQRNSGKLKERKAHKVPCGDDTRTQHLHVSSNQLSKLTERDKKGVRGVSAINSTPGGVRGVSATNSTPGGVRGVSATNSTPGGVRGVSTTNSTPGGMSATNNPPWPGDDRSLPDSAHNPTTSERKLNASDDLHPANPDHTHQANSDHTHQTFPDHTHQDIPDHTHRIDPDHTHQENPDHTHSVSPDHTHQTDPSQVIPDQDHIYQTFLDHTHQATPGLDHTHQAFQDHVHQVIPGHTQQAFPDHTHSNDISSSEFSNVSHSLLEADNHLMSMFNHRSFTDNFPFLPPSLFSNWCPPYEPSNTSIDIMGTSSQDLPSGAGGRSQPAAPLEGDVGLSPYNTRSKAKAAAALRAFSISPSPHLDNGSPPPALGGMSLLSSPPGAGGMVTSPPGGLLANRLFQPVFPDEPEIVFHEIQLGPLHTMHSHTH